MPPALTLDLDPTISEADLEAAFAAIAAPFYPAALDDTGPGPWPLTRRQDDLTELGGPAPGAPRTPAQALAAARQISRGDVYVGVGYCHRTVRGYYGVGPVWPDAETACEQTDQRHPETDPQAIPRGVPVWWLNGGYGHVALSAGGGMCWTTDYRRTGFVDLAPIAALASWCRGRLWGWSEDINEVDVWDAKAPRRFTLEDRLAVVTRQLERARANDAPDWRLEGLREWRDQLKTRIDRKD